MAYWIMLSNVRISDELLNEMLQKEVLAEILSRHVAAETEENQEQSQPREMVSEARFKPSKFQVRSISFLFATPLDKHDQNNNFFLYTFAIIQVKSYYYPVLILYTNDFLS